MYILAASRSQSEMYLHKYSEHIVTEQETLGDYGSSYYTPHSLYFRSLLLTAAQASFSRSLLIGGCFLTLYVIGWHDYIHSVRRTWSYDIRAAAINIYGI